MIQMSVDYLHKHKEFKNLLEILSDEMGIVSQLIEKDYWIMQVLYGLQEKGFEFELKGGTSLSKGFKIINRFSEDLDIHIKPSKDFHVETNPKKSKPGQIASRKNYYDWLAENIKIDGIVKTYRDTNFDEARQYRSGGIRLVYNSVFENIEGLKEGILLEVGFDTVTPNEPLTISSWAFDKALATPEVKFIDNRAVNVLCYHPGYTLVEKLQTIVRKFKNEQEEKTENPNLMRQYYDVFCLLDKSEIKTFIGSHEYLEHKKKRFSKEEFKVPINQNEAFLLSDQDLREGFIQRYKSTKALYYSGQPDFENVISRIQEFIDRL